MLRRQLVRILGCVPAAVVAITVGLSGQTANPLSGTWKLNLANSKYQSRQSCPEEWHHEV